MDLAMTGTTEPDNLKRLAIIRMMSNHLLTIITEPTWLSHQLPTFHSLPNTIHGTNLHHILCSIPSMTFTKIFFKLWRRQCPRIHHTKDK